MNLWEVGGMAEILGVIAMAYVLTVSISRSRSLVRQHKDPEMLLGSR